MGRIPRNVRGGQWIATVERLGCVPPCVRDAFSWLPHPYTVTRGVVTWFWMGKNVERRRGGIDYEADPPTPQRPDSERCSSCIFQEPPWSQGYAGCSHSWLHDRDGDCQGFVARPEFLERQPSYAEFCRPPSLGDNIHLLPHPYWSDGTRYSDFGPSCNLPSGYHARISKPGWFEAGACSVYASLERERHRRFWQWARDKTAEETGAFQYNMFVSDAIRQLEMEEGNEE